MNVFIDFDNPPLSAIYTGKALIQNPPTQPTSQGVPSNTANTVVTNNNIQDTNTNCSAGTELVAGSCVPVCKAGEIRGPNGNCIIEVRGDGGKRTINAENCTGVDCEEIDKEIAQEKDDDSGDDETTSSDSGSNDDDNEDNGDRNSEENKSTEDSPNNENGDNQDNGGDGDGDSGEDSNNGNGGTFGGDSFY